MTSSLPSEVRECFERFITTEFTTVDARQQPITWPVTPYYRQGAPTIDVTTELGDPKKADDARRNPRVALLFSDPTGSGVHNELRVLVQGTAEVDERDLEANRERYFRESVAKLPATRRMHPPRPLRGPLSWHLTRIYVKVRPERVLIWPRGNLGDPPEILDANLEEVRSGHSEQPAVPHADSAGGAVAWDTRLDELGMRHRTAVLSWVGPDGFPLSVRVPAAADRPRHRIALDADPAGLPLSEGRACLTAHAHGEDLTWRESVQVRGDLVAREEGWALIPHKLVGGFEPPRGLERYRSLLSRQVRFYRTARRRLRSRRG